MHFLILFIFLSLTPSFEVTSPAFKNKELIPMKYTCEGANVSPPLSFSNLPLRTKTLVLIVDDPDAANKTFDHWLLWNIPFTTQLEENIARGVQGGNGKQENKYTGPCPPEGTHHYQFKVYALDASLELPEGSEKKALLHAIQGHILDSALLVGLYKKTKS